MRAMVLAAGRGERMRPLTDGTPKPLLSVRGKPLIVHVLEGLRRAAVRDVVINLAWLGEQLRAILGDGSAWDLRLHYSDEGAEALETGGGVVHALPLLGSEPFLVVAGDIYSDFEFSRLRPDGEALAELVMVPNPPYHPEGDFGLLNGRVIAGGPRYTYASIGLYTPEFFADCVPGRLPLLPLLRRAIAAGRVRGQLYQGPWHNVGTPADLAALQLAAGPAAP